jgi:hypothetical protein
LLGGAEKNLKNPQLGYLVSRLKSEPPKYKAGMLTIQP